MIIDEYTGGAGTLVSSWSLRLEVKLNEWGERRRVSIEEVVLVAGEMREDSLIIKRFGVRRG